MLKHGILGLLNYNDMNGYEILETFRNSLNHFWNVQKSQVYRELTTLEYSGYIKGTWERQEGKPDKKIYAITDDGRAELLEWLSQESTGITRIPVLMKTFFLGEKSVDENIAFFNRLRESYLLRYEDFAIDDNTSQEYSDELQDAYRSMFWGFTISYGRKLAKMTIKWCDECISQLEKISELKEKRNR